MSQKMIWVDEELAAHLEIIGDVAKLQNTSITKIMNDLLDDTTNMAECLDENTLRFKLHAKQIRDEYKKTVEAELDATYKIWEECEELRKKAKDKLDLVSSSFKVVKNDIDKIRSELSDINLYGVDKLMETIKKFQNMSDEDKETLSQLLLLKKSV